MQKRKFKNRLIHRALQTGLGFYFGMGHKIRPSLENLSCKLAWKLSKHEKQIALTQLQERFTDGDTDAAELISLGITRHLARSLFEALELWRGNTEILNEVHFTPGSLKRLQDATAEGRGVMVFTGHIGNWELMAAKLVDAGFPTATFAKSSYDPQIDELVNSFRSSYRIKSIDRDAEDAFEKASMYLKQGYLLGALVDQDTKVSSVGVPFFGKTAKTPIGPAVLAIKNRVAAVSCTIRRVENQHWIHVEGPYEMKTDQATQQQAFELTAWATSKLEEAIRKAPEQWVWFHRRWRNQ